LNMGSLNIGLIFMNSGTPGAQTLVVNGNPSWDGKSPYDSKPYSSGSDFGGFNVGGTGLGTSLGILRVTSGSVSSFTITGIPEPSTWAMIGAGALGLLAMRRRRA
ncbi:MAG: PEP-CTERM sorting domain-containing protein, partial [Verrucomicrobiia bacterium]